MSTFNHGGAGDDFGEEPQPPQSDPFDDDDASYERFDSAPVFSSGEEAFSNSGGGAPAFSTDNGGAGELNGPIFPLPLDMQPEEGFALREWRRLNAIRLAEKEKEEKEVVKEIIAQAEEFKKEFHKKRHVAIENRKASNREKEKMALAGQEMFHAEADKQYWKAISELIPHEVPTIEKRGKKDKDKKASIVVLQGPKPGKPTDMSRMRQVLVKLKHNPPPHMKPKPPPAEAGKDPKAGGPASGATPAKGAAAAKAPISSPTKAGPGST